MNRDRSKRRQSQSCSRVSDDDDDGSSLRSLQSADSCSKWACDVPPPRHKITSGTSSPRPYRPSFQSVLHHSSSEPNRIVTSRKQGHEHSDLHVETTAASEQRSRNAFRSNGSRSFNSPGANIPPVPFGDSNNLKSPSPLQERHMETGSQISQDRTSTMEFHNGTKKRKHDRSRMIAFKKTDPKLLKIHLGFPTASQKLGIDPQPQIPHPRQWTRGNKVGVYVQQVITAFNEQTPKDTTPILKSLPAPLSSAIPIENALFKGVGMIRIRGIGSAADVYFAGKRRKHQLIIQGSFKHRYRADEIWGGQIFRHAWTNMPSSWLIRAGLSTAKMLNPSMSERLQSAKNPFVLFPWISMPQKVHITHQGHEPPSIYDPDGISEDCSLLGPQFKNKEGAFRRKYFTDYSKLKSVYYEKDMIYTFEDYQDALDFNSFDLNLKISTLDIALRLHDMPLEMGAMKFKPTDLTKNSKVEDEFEALESVPYFWRFQLWPKHCVINRYYSSEGVHKTESQLISNSMKKKK